MAKQRLVENFILNPDNYQKKPLQEGQEEIIQIEEKSGKKENYKAKAVYTFSISKPDVKNLNERVYSSKLWEKQIKKMKNESTYGLMNHPDGDGSTKDIWCVWRNLRFNEEKDVVIADAYLVGRWGADVLEMLEAGGKVGLSTSGFGEFQEDNHTIDPDTYELERIADFVFNPSFQVYGENSDRVDTTDKKESVEKVDSPLIEEVQDKEKDMQENKKMTSIEEKAFRLNLLSSFKEAKGTEGLDERISAYKELLTYFEGDVASDVKADIEKALSEDLAKKEDFAKKGETFDKVNDEKKSLEENVVSLTEKVTLLESEKKELEEKYQMATELLDSMKVYSSKQKEMLDITRAEKNGMISASEYKEALVYVEGVEEERDALRKENLELKKQVRSLKEKGVKKEEEPEDKEDPENPEDPEDKKDKEDDKKDDKEKADENVNRDVLRYYESLEYSQPKAVMLKKEILSCKTLMEAQKKYMNLKGLLSEDSPYDRVVVREKNTHAESSKQTLNIRKGWK